MYNLDNLEKEFYNNLNNLKELLNKEANISTYNQYLLYYEAVANYNILRLEANTNDQKAYQDFQKVGKLKGELEDHFSLFIKGSNDPLIKYTSLHLNSESKTYNLLSPAKGWQKYYQELFTSNNLPVLLGDLASPNQDIRKKSTEKLEEINNTKASHFNSCLNNIKTTANNYATLRGFDNCLEMSLYDNKLSSKSL